MSADESRDGDMTNGLSDRELLASFRDGESAHNQAYGQVYDQAYHETYNQAHNELWRRHHPAALRAARQYERNGPPEEIAAEAFARVLEAARHGSGPAEAFRSYLLRTVFDVAQEAARVRQQSALFDEPEHRDTPPGENVSAPLGQHDITRAYERLTSPQREILWYVEAERTSTADAAVFMGLSAEAAEAVADGARGALGREYVQIHLEHVGDRPECYATLTKLERYVHSSLTAPDRALVDRHLEECASCTLALADLRDLGGSMRSVLGPIMLGPAAAGYFLEATEQPPAGVIVMAGAAAGQTAGGARSFVRVTGAAAATVLVVGGLAAGAVMVTDGGEMAPTEAGHRDAAIGRQGPPASDEPTPNVTSGSTSSPTSRNTPTRAGRSTPTSRATPVASRWPTSNPTAQPTSTATHPQPSPSHSATTGPETPEPDPSPTPSPSRTPEPTSTAPAPPTGEPTPRPSPSPTSAPLTLISQQLEGPYWNESDTAYVLAVADGIEPGSTVTLRVTGPLLTHTSEPVGTVPSAPPLVDDGAWDCSGTGLLSQGYECTTTANAHGKATAAVATGRTLGALQQQHELQVEVAADGEQDETTVTVQ